MKKPRSIHHEAINQHIQHADYKPKNSKHRQPSNKQKSSLMGFYAAARKQGGKA